MFTKGAVVEWKSQAAGRVKKKTGEVVAVIAPGEAFPGYRLQQKLDCKSAYGGGYPRDHKSYAVLVPHHGNGKPTLYWPRVSALRLAK